MGDHPRCPALTRTRAAVVITLAVVVLAGGVAPTGCSWPEKDRPSALQGDPVRIGIPLPLTGAKAAFGETKRNAYVMAMEEINALGGVDGQPLLAIFRDTAGEPTAAAAAAVELITIDGAVLLAGEYSSACALAVAEVAQKHGIPYLIDSAAADVITQKKWPLVFRLNPPASLYAQGLTGFLGEVVKPRSMAIAYEQGDFGVSLARAMRDWCLATGVSLPVYESYEPGTLDFTELVAKIREADADVVYLVSYLVDASLFIRQARSQGLEPRLFAGGVSGFVLPEFIISAAEAAENVVTAALWSPDLGFPGAAEFAETYRARYGTLPSYHAAEAYACLQVVDEALHRAASTDPERIRAALAETETVTAFGPVRFEAFGKYQNQNRMETVVLQIIGGQFNVVWPPECATAEYVLPDAGG